MKPNLFPWIPGLHEETEIYTQHRAVSEPIANYKFTLLTLFNWIKARLGLLTVVIEFPTPILVWNCAHLMGRRALYKCEDLDGNILHGKEEYIDDDNEKITWKTARAGRAIFS